MIVKCKKTKSEVALDILKLKCSELENRTEEQIKGCRELYTGYDVYSMYTTEM